MKKKILISAPFDFLPETKESLDKEFECSYFYLSGKQETEILLKENSYEGWLVSPCPTYQITGEMMDLCPSLKIIASPSTGTNHINLNDAEKRSIKVYSLKGTEVVNTIKASSEFTFNLMLSTIRKTPYAFQGVLNGEWRESEEKYRGRELDGLTLGIIGFGRIGSNLAKYSKAFNMNILAYDPYVKISNPDIQPCDSLDDLLPEPDVVAVCVHLNEETKGMINASVFQQMKERAYFINTSRGDVVNEHDLIAYLKNGKILAAGVDVISDEFMGNINKHPLIQYARKHNNLIITPHIAGLTFDSERKAQTAAYRAIKHFLS